MKIQLSNGLVPIGINKKKEDESNDEENGVIPESIRVNILKGSPDLLHVTWRDYPQGMGVYTNEYFLVCAKANPERTLVSGAVPTHGRWGGGRSCSGSVAVRYSGNTLCVKQSTLYNDWSPTPKPLYAVAQIQDSDPIYVCRKSTTVTRTFTVSGGGAELSSTLLEYDVQSGDTIDDICDGLKVDKEWIVNGNLISKNVSRIQVDIPNPVSKQRYPKFPNSEYVGPLRLK